MLRASRLFYICATLLYIADSHACLIYFKMLQKLAVKVLSRKYTFQQIVQDFTSILRFLIIPSRPTFHHHGCIVNYINFSNIPLPRIILNFSQNKRTKLTLFSNYKSQNWLKNPSTQIKAQHWRSKQSRLLYTGRSHTVVSPPRSIPASRHTH